MNFRAWAKKHIQELPTGEYVCKVTTLDNTRAFDVLGPIVRCKDCAYFGNYPNDEIKVCYRFDNEQPIVEPDGFCAWGKRKVVEE